MSKWIPQFQEQCSADNDSRFSSVKLSKADVDEACTQLLDLYDESAAQAQGASDAGASLTPSQITSQSAAAMSASVPGTHVAAAAAAPDAKVRCPFAIVLARCFLLPTLSVHPLQPPLSSPLTLVSLSLFFSPFLYPSRYVSCSPPCIPHRFLEPLPVHDTGFARSLHQQSSDCVLSDARAGASTGRAAAGAIAAPKQS